MKKLFASLCAFVLLIGSVAFAAVLSGQQVFVEPSQTIIDTDDNLAADETDLSKSSVSSSAAVQIACASEYASMIKYDKATASHENYSSDQLIISGEELINITQRDVWRVQLNSSVIGVGAISVYVDYYTGDVIGFDFTADNSSDLSDAA